MKLQKLHTAPIIHALSMVQVNYYGDARLVCNVTGYPSPAITWKYNNVNTLLYIVVKVALAVKYILPILIKFSHLIDSNVKH